MWLRLKKQILLITKKSTAAVKTNADVINGYYRQMVILHGVPDRSI